MAHTHTLPNFIKLSLLLCDCLAKDSCYELASIWRCYDKNMSYAEYELNMIKDSLVTLTSVSLTSRNYQVLNDLREKHIVEMRNDNFIADTEKSRSAHSWYCVCLIEHSPLTKLDSKSIIKLPLH